MYLKKLFAVLIIILIISGITYGASEEALIEESSNEIQEQISDNQEYEEPYADPNYSYETLKAKVIEANEPYDEYMGIDLKYQDLKVRITDKKYNGTVLSIKYDLSYYLDASLTSDPLKVNDDVLVVLAIEGNKIVNQNILGVNRQNHFIYIAIIFVIGIIAIGGIKGIKALIGLVITLIVIFFIMIPQIYKGNDPMLVTVLSSVFIIISTFIIIGGINKKTLGAIIGTSCGIIIAGLISIIFSKLMLLSGIGEESLMLTTLDSGAKLNFKGIMFAGIVIGALGACMNIGMSIASSIEELKRVNPEMTVGQLIKSGMNIGRDSMATMINTLILAYIGGSLTIVFIYLGLDYKLFEVLNQESISEEILRAMAGSIGLICTIPLTTVASALLMEKRSR
jgi:uncharacterized membrane protein